MFKGLNLLKLAPLATKYASLKSSEMTAEVLREIADVAGLAYTEQGLTDVVEMIRQGDLDTIADYMSQPDRLRALMSHLAPTPEPVLCRCPHCQEVFELHYEN